jgi:hypothetical protein
MYLTRNPSATAILGISLPLFILIDNVYSISDKGIVAAMSDGKNINYTKFGSSEWHLILDDPNRTCLGGFPTFVSNELISIPCKDLTVLTTEGKSYSLPIEHSSASEMGSEKCQSYAFHPGTSVSAEAPVVALTYPVFKVKKPFLREPEICFVGLEIVVFNLNLKRQVLKLNIAPLPTDAYDFALSPDGTKLAVLEDRKVSLYAIPSSPAKSNPGAGN